MGMAASASSPLRPPSCYADSNSRDTFLQRGLPFRCPLLLPLPMALPHPLRLLHNSSSSLPKPPSLSPPSSLPPLSPTSCPSRAPHPLLPLRIPMGREEEEEEEGRGGGGQVPLPPLLHLLHFTRIRPLLASARFRIAGQGQTECLRSDGALRCRLRGADCPCICHLSLGPPSSTTCLPNACRGIIVRSIHDIMQGREELGLQGRAEATDIRLWVRLSLRPVVSSGGEPWERRRRKIRSDGCGCSGRRGEGIS